MSLERKTIFCSFLLHLYSITSIRKNSFFLLCFTMQCSNRKSFYVFIKNLQVILQRKTKNKENNLPHLCLKYINIYIYRCYLTLKTFQSENWSWDYFFNSVYLASVMYTFSVVFREEDLVLFASLNWKIHFYFPCGKDSWKALIFEQR